MTRPAEGPASFTVGVWSVTRDFAPSVHGTNNAL